ncbi:MAG: SpoIID/LytB domain-containing protein [Crocosphaera sp.]|nr:SpoIID/LytB domain-containing protein [Crocosphaera sp.]
MKKLLKNLFVNRPHLWGFPVVCVFTLPIIITRWQPSTPPSVEEIPTNPLPSLSQLQPTQHNSQITTENSDIQTPYLKQPKLKSPQPQPKNPPESPKNTNITQKLNPQSPPKQAPPPSPKSLAPAPPNYQPPPLDIRVAILRDAPGTTLGVSGQAIVSDRQNKQIKTLTGNQGWNIRPSGNFLSFGGKSLPGVVWVQSAEGGLIYVGDRWYRGKILLVSQGNSLLVVNHVDLEHYLYSVVGSEMHANAPTEALKAQAIAARSYALVHMIRPASNWYDLGNTQRWQVYKGLNSEYNTGHHAVQSTTGQILSHQGGVVESLYAATDEIVARAHKGRGMSQTGAYKLARKGYDYQQILDHYYPGVGLSRLVVSN